MVNSTQGWQTNHPGKISKPFFVWCCQNGALQPMPGELGAPAAAISYFARCDREVAELLGG